MRLYRQCVGLKVAVVGGGITGLSACFELEKLGCRVVLFEASQKLGGKIQTRLEAGCCVEQGPDSIFIRDGLVPDFIAELGLDGEVLEPKTKGFSILYRGKLVEAPSGVARVGSIDRAALLSFAAMSEEGKKRALSEKFVQRCSDADETVRGFFSRRFGNEYAELIALPLFAGTHGGNAHKLSMEALYPRLREAERIYGSLTEASSKGSLAPFSRFISFRHGTSVLPKAIAGQLSKTKIVHKAVASVRASSERVEVEGQVFEGAILCTPAKAAAAVLKSIDPHTSHSLGALQSVPSKVVTLALDLSENYNLCGTGFLVPESEDSAITAATWSSRKWSNRAPEGMDLIRVFLKGTEANVESTTLAVEGIREILKLKQTPRVVAENTWEGGLPLYETGHHLLVQDVQARLLRVGPIYLAGHSYRGVGIPECIRQGQESARMLVTQKSTLS